VSRFVVRAVTRAALAVGFLSGVIGIAADTDPAAYASKLEEFPPADAGVDLAGELVAVDHLLRRGGLRLDGDFDEDRYRWSPTFTFMLLPYGTVTYHGAPADLNDVALGTRLLGRFLLPPEGDTAIARRSVSLASITNGQGSKPVARVFHASGSSAACETGVVTVTTIP
jgi:hypothetical protein